MNYVILERLVEMFYFEFMQIMKNGRQIKRCKNCGKYFVLTDKDMAEDDFIEWSNLFSKVREEFKAGKISGEEFIKTIWRD